MGTMGALQGQQYFVSAAIVAAELHKAMLVAREISLTASNARALALRAGHGAAGFRAITEFIEELARKTVAASRDINTEAVRMSRTASEIARTKDAVTRFKKAVERAQGYANIDTIQPVLAETQSQFAELENQFHRQINQLVARLEELGRELRTATVLAAMSRVEASASGREFESSLNVIAENVAKAAGKIQTHVKNSQQLFNEITLV